MRRDCQTTHSGFGPSDLAGMDHADEDALRDHSLGRFLPKLAGCGSSAAGLSGGN
jgi:hypothetical protein